MSLNNETAEVEQGARLEAALWTFQSFLGREGLRFTEQRRDILTRVLEQPAHFDAEGLHRRLVEDGEQVSLATVYRTLALLLEAGLIKEVLRCSGRTHYETVYGHPHHDHMVCVECGKVIEFYDGRIEELQRKICREHDFRAMDHRMGIRGVCAECRAARADGGGSNGD
jgi:Fur family ferric uptake transcriptional regulator